MPTYDEVRKDTMEVDILSEARKPVWRCTRKSHFFVPVSPPPKTAAATLCHLHSSTKGCAGHLEARLALVSRWPILRSGATTTLLLKPPANNPASTAGMYLSPPFYPMS